MQRNRLHQFCTRPPRPARGLRGQALLLAGLLLLAAVPVRTDESFTLEARVLAQAEAQYGKAAVGRLTAWQELIREDASATEMEKIIRVNTFFNRMQFTSDRSHWQQEDYWATPVEFLASGGGDCEDFSIAKFFTLKAIGVDEGKINITYVKALELNQAHMVLTYYSDPAAEPLVLDNLTDEVLPASRRPDLLPVYTFNGAGLWIAKERGKGRMVGSSNRLKSWREMLLRMSRDYH